IGGGPMVKSVMVYRNGDPFFPGRRVVINEKKVASFDVFLKEVTGGVNASFGAVRNIYTPRGGHRVRQLDDIQSGQCYVAGGREAFKKLNLTSMVLQNPQLLITFCHLFSLFANGDLVSPAVRLFIPRKTLNQWDHVLEMVTEKVTLRSGAVHRLYTLDGKPVESGLDLENGQFYVAAGRDKFKKLPYSELPKPCLNKVFTCWQSLWQRQNLQGSRLQTFPFLGCPRMQFTHLPHSVTIGLCFSLLTEEGIYKAGTKRSEMRGAVEVQEDEDTQTEVPVDQVIYVSIRGNTGQLFTSSLGRTKHQAADFT
uniref:Doublecortin domain-containing protein 2 n=1 Tax=Varanus komodoensis TaxID=61221 RepID=A0A8D2JC09_VARKO